jgi:hypothetical protein
VHVGDVVRVGIFVEDAVYVLEGGGGERPLEIVKEEDLSLEEWGV